MSMFVGMSTIAKAAVDYTSDIAYNLPTASYTASSAAQPAINAFDNDANLTVPVTSGPSTRWESAQPDASLNLGVADPFPQWLEVDLGKDFSVSGFQIMWENAAAATYTIQISRDNIHWTTAYTGTNPDGSNGPAFDAFVNAASTTDGNNDFTTTVGRYVRMYATTRTLPYGYSIWDFQVYGSAVDTSAMEPSPTISPLNQSFTAATPVTLIDTDADATIYYTTDGTYPTAIPADEYTAPFIVSTTSTVEAIACKAGADDSDPSSSTVTILSVPTGLTATLLTTSDAASLTWSSEAGVSTYNIYRSLNCGDYTKVKTDPVAATSYLDIGL